MLWTDRIFKKKVSTNKEVNEIISSIENSKKTMGGFIKQVQQSYSLTVAIVEKLDKILETRNYLVHEYFKLNISKCYSEIGQLEMIKYFCDFIDDSKKLDEELKIYYAGYQAKFHIAEEKIEQLMSEMKAQELARVAEKGVK